MAIVDYISEDNPDAALALMEEIQDKVAQLPVHPKRCRPGMIEGTRELVVRPNYIVVYAETEAAVNCVCAAAAEWRMLFSFRVFGPVILSGRFVLHDQARTCPRVFRGDLKLGEVAQTLQIERCEKLQCRDEGGRSACTDFRCKAPPSAQSGRRWHMHCGTRAHRYNTNRQSS